jgi:cyclic nucleotide gated channel beta 1
MYIVDSGVIEVFVNNKPVAQLDKGSVFGEISLLSVGAEGNRRTANVISKGFSTLYVLHKDDLNEVLRDYPDVEVHLRKKARCVQKSNHHFGRGCQPGFIST